MVTNDLTLLHIVVNFPPAQAPRALLLKAWRDNPTRELAEIGIVDIREPQEVKASWSDFIVRTHGSASKDFSYNLLMRQAHDGPVRPLHLQPFNRIPGAKIHSRLISRSMTCKAGLSLSSRKKKPEN